MQWVKTEDNAVTFPAVGSSGQFSRFGTWNWQVREGYMYTLDFDWQFLEIKELVLTLDKDHRPGLTINWGSKTSNTWVKKSTLNSSQICPLYEFLQHFNNVFEIKCLDTIIDMIL